MPCLKGSSAAAQAVARLLLCAAAAIPSGTAFGAGTPAGTSIVNVASATYLDDDVPQTVFSNSHAIRVEEVLDVVVSPIGAQPQSVAPGAPEYLVTFRVTNIGNGPEAFDLAGITAIGGDRFDPSLVRIAVDRDGDGIYSPLVDTVFAPGAEPLLPPDASVDVFVFVALPAGVAGGDDGFVRLSATALSGSGAPGTLFAGAGELGSDAVVGNSGASAASTGALLVTLGQPVLVKSQSFDPPGQPSSGTTVTYTLAANLAGVAAVAPRIVDPVPVGTTYVPGSLRLDGAPLSDAVDGDAGSASGAAIEVALNPAAAGQQVVTFQVRVN